MKKILNPYLNKEGYNCVCCAPNNPVGLHLEFWEEGEDVLTIWNPGENYQGWINTLHGGQNKVPRLFNDRTYIDQLTADERSNDPK